MKLDAAVLIVDDEPELRELLAETLTVMGIRALSAASAQEALAILQERVPDVVLADVRMPGMSGIELCRQLKQDPRFQLVPVVILTAIADLDARVAGLEAGADDFFAKPVHMVELRARLKALLRTKALTDELEQAETLIRTLSLTIESRDPYTAGHCERLAKYAVALGGALGLDPAMLKALWLAGFLHDLGKIAVPDPILLKPGRLTAEEREQIKVHPVRSDELVSGLRSLGAARPFIRHHHERLDGSGYPDGLRGDAIPLGARVMAVVDVYDALHSARPYKPPLTHEAAVSILLQETDKGWWDPRVVTTFVDVLNTARP